MDQKFQQLLADKLVFDKLTAALPFLRNEKLSEDHLKGLMKDLEKNGILKALKDSDQDPKELVDMYLLAFNNAVSTMKNRLEAASVQVVEILQQQRFSNS